jgi:hypothetical protein
MSDPIARLLSTRPQDEDDASRYRSIVTHSRPQMGFAITRANGDMDGFLYHNLDNLHFEMRGAAEFLSFTHRGKAVTIQGKGMRAIFQAILRHTLAELNEPDGRPAQDGLPVIIRIAVTALGQGAPMVKLARAGDPS